MGVRNALTFVGAVVGAFYGQPQLGAAIGPAVGGMSAITVSLPEDAERRI